jgi:hypothetical protein
MAKRKKVRIGPIPIRQRSGNDRIVTKLMRLAAEGHLRDKERTDIIWRKDKAADALEWT